MSDQPLDAEIKLPSIIGFGIGLVAIMVVVTALMWWLSLGLRDHLASDDPAPAALPEARVQELPPGPALQSDPIGEMTRMRADEDAILEGADWADQASGVARIPIDVAIEAVAAAGNLPQMDAPEPEIEAEAP